MADNGKHYALGAYTVEPKYGNSSAVSKQGSGTTNYQMTERNNYYDKPSNSYVRETNKQSYSSGDYSNRGKSGYKAEMQASSTVKVGDSQGYTEYYKQEKVTRVDYNSAGNKGYNNNYGGGSKSSGYGGGKKYLN